MAQSRRFRVHMEHKRYFQALKAVEIDAVRYSLCAKCHEIATDACGSCKVEFYCGKTCQKADWPRHKLSCGKDAATRAREIAAAFVPAQTAEKPCAVLLMLRKTSVTVHMSKEEMMTYALFVAAIKAVVSDFDEDKEFGWQHWQTVREAWNPYR
jgi:hypothetical protein